MISSYQTVSVMTLFVLMAKSSALPLNVNPTEVGRNIAGCGAASFLDFGCFERLFINALGKSIATAFIKGYEANIDIVSNTVTNTAADVSEMIAESFRNVGTIMSNNILKSSKIMAANVEASNTVGTNFASAMFNSLNGAVLARDGAITVQNVGDDITNEEAKEISDSVQDQVTNTDQVINPNV